MGVKRLNITPSFRNARELARFIDQSLLKPHATEADVRTLCKDALLHSFHAVCVHPCFVSLCKNLLAGHATKVTTVIGFPLGVSLREIKTYEAIQSILHGAEELDIVMNIGAAKSGNWRFVEKELSEIIAASPSVIHKVIIETCYLDDDEKKRAAEVTIACGADFIKTSTGFGPKGATVGDVRLLKAVAKDNTEIKAAGGIKTLSQALRLIKAGATRIGTSAGVAIMREASHSY